MGLEATCKIEWQNTAARARVHLDSNKLDVYLKPTLHFAFGDMRKVVANDGELQITLAAGALVLHLGAAAERWAGKIKQPKSRLDKLGLTVANKLVCWIGARDQTFEDELLARVETLHHKPVKGAEVVFLRASHANDLDKVATLRASLAPNAALWIVRDKGKAAPVREGDVRAAAKAAGLVGMKVVSFSDTLTADKFVIPLAKR